MAVPIESRRRQRRDRRCKVIYEIASAIYGTHCANPTVLLLYKGCLIWG
jgi:hypothetical protein